MDILAQRLAHLAYLTCSTSAFLALGCADTAQLEAPAELEQQPVAVSETVAGSCGENPDWFFRWDYSGDWSHARSSEHSVQYPSDPFYRFDGWTTVERSSATELILAADSQLNGLRDAPAIVNATAHCNIYGTELPVLAPGARLWLHFSGDFVPGAARVLNYRHDFGREMSVRARPEGPLFLGGITSPAEAERIETDALTFTEPVELCGEENKLCWVDGRASQHSLLALTDEPQRVSAGPASAISIDGMPYALTFVGASQYTGTQRDRSRCPDFTGDTRLWVSADIQAEDPQPIIDALDHGAVPACSVGNEPVVDVRATLYGGSVSEWVADAEIVYRGTEKGNYVFDVSATGDTFEMSFNALRAEPAPGTQYSLSYQYDAFVLRTAPGGEILAAHVWLPEMLDEQRNTLGVFTSWLGVPLTREQICSYEAQTSPSMPEQFVRQVTFGTTPATVVREGSRSVASIDGRSYDVLVWKVQRATIVWITPPQP